VKPTPLFYGSLHTVIKLFAIAFTCVYLHLSVGVVKTTHYCMGRESSSIFYTFEAKRCGCSLFLSNLEKNTCCHDESELIVIDNDQTPTSVFSLTAPDYFPIAELYNTGLQLATSLTKNESDFYLNNSLPPPKEPLYKTLCAYTLYEEELMS
jgi:hypothetical protein